MSAFWIALVLLLLVGCMLFLAAGWRQRQARAGERDRLNQRFYRQRIEELVQNEEQGVVAERSLMERELQQTLLVDIPPAQTLQSYSRRRWILLPGLIMLIVVSLGTYLKTGGLAQFTGWMQVQLAYPELRARLMDPGAKALSMDELARL